MARRHSVGYAALALSLGVGGAAWSVKLPYALTGNVKWTAFFCATMSGPAGRVVIRAVHNPKPGARAQAAPANIVPSARIAAMLEKPTWSVRSLLPEANSSAMPTVTSKQLHHLLRLSALPPPKNEQEETKMLKILESQIHFVREIQKVDTTGVEPLRAIRDETAEGAEEQTIKLADLQEFLDAEEVVGRNGRIKRQPREDPEAKAGKDWDPFAMSQGKKMGKYFFVRKEKKAQVNDPTLTRETSP